MRKEILENMRLLLILAFVYLRWQADHSASQMIDMPVETVHYFKKKSNET